MATFYRESGNGRATRQELPQAIRPAVEIIARLSAERNRLREDVARLREAVRSCPKPSAVARLRAERDAMALERDALRRERDALAQELAEVKLRNRAGTSGRSMRPEPLSAVIERLERAVARLETSGQTARSARPQAGSQAVSRDKSGLGSGRRKRPIPGSSKRNSVLGNLVRANLELRGQGSPAAPAGGTTEQVKTPGRGGGLLTGLVNQNLGLRQRGTRN